MKTAKSFLPRPATAMRANRGVSRLRVESLEDRRMMAVDLSDVVPNLDFEDYERMPEYHSNMSHMWDLANTNGTVDYWRGISTSDYFNTGFMGDGAFIATEPLGGSLGFVGVQKHGNYHETAAINLWQLDDFIPGNQVYEFDLYLGASEVTEIFENGFQGEVVVYGFLDGGELRYYTGDLPMDLTAQSGDYVELYSEYVELAPGEWRAIPGVQIAPSVNLDGIGFSLRSSDERAYLFVDTSRVAPRVQQVTISGPNALDGNRPTPNGSYDVPVGSGQQLKTVPVGGANKISLQFNKGVTVSSTDLDIIALNKVVTEPGVSSFDPPTSLNNYTATWTYSTAFPAAQYLMSLSDAVVDAYGQHLDGEWTNPGSMSATGTSVFPSGDGYAGGNFDFVFTILPGDANGDLTVSFADFSALQANMNQSNKSWAQGNFNGDGSVSFADLSAQQATYNYNWQALYLLADLSGADYDVDGSDETIFLAAYGTNNLLADLNGSGTITSADYDAFYELFNFGIQLEIVV